jgi:hypothetical protein
MRRSAALTSGVSAAAALLPLAACGGGDSADSSASSSSSTDGSGSTQTSVAPGSSESDADPQAFCTQATEAGGDLDAPSAQPAAVADDWSALIASLNRLSDAADGIDFAADPNAFTTFEQFLAQEAGPYTQAEAGVTDYIRTECGIDPATGETLPS